MPELHDYRTNPLPETSFYVYDDLRAWQKGKKDTIYRYNTLEEAISKFQDLPNDMTSALGISYRDVNEIDLVQKNRGEPFLVSDYMRVDFIQNIPDFNSYLDMAKNKLHLYWKSEYSLFGKDLSGVLIPIDEGLRDESYINNRTLRPKDETYPFSAINEFFNEGVGWQNYADIKKSAEIIYGNTQEYRKPRISKLAVDYLYTNPDSGNTNIGTMDMDIAGYRLFLDRTVEKVKKDIHKKIDTAQMKQKKQLKHPSHEMDNKMQKGAQNHEQR